MLTENDVVKAVALHLTKSGYRIDKLLTTKERGIDIVAVHPKTKIRVLVEAKGGTSSKPATPRFGKPFGPNQSKTHVAVAFYVAVKLCQLHSSDDTRVAMAFPDDRMHRSHINSISDALRLLEISVYFVDAAGRVTLLAG